MKIYFLVLLFLVSLFSCKEDGPFINFDEGQASLLDTSYLSPTPISSSRKNVLFEEFSGVRCSNCPSGNAETHSLHNQLGNRLVVVTIHSDFLGYPYPGSQDLRNNDANEIASSLGPVGQKPSAFVNRKIINGQRLQASIATWASKINSELSSQSFANIELEIINYDISLRTFTYRVTIMYSNDAPSHNLGFMLTESKIEAEQLDGSSHIHDYEHEFVLRKSITPIIGEPMPNNIVANTVVIKEYTVDINDFDTSNLWQIENMHLIAFIRLDNDDIETASVIDIE